MKGFYNKVLQIEVATEGLRVESVDDDLLGAYLWGKGLATQLLLRQNPDDIDGLSPRNHLIFATGPTTGTGMRGSCRYGVLTRSHWATAGGGTFRISCS